MDKLEKYIIENEDNFSIEDVDGKVWQRVSKAAVPKRRSFIKEIKISIKSFFQTNQNRKEGYTRQRKSNKFKLAYAFVFFAFVIVSCTYKVKSYSKYGDIITFALAKNSYLLNAETNAKSLLQSFSRSISPFDSSSFLFFKCIKENNPEGKQIIKNLKETPGVSDLVVTPVMFEFKESLFSSFVYKAFEIQITKPKPNAIQIRDKVKDILKEKGLSSVDVQIDGNSQDVLFSTKTIEQEPLLQSIEDSVVITNDIIDKTMVTTKTDTIKPKEDVKNSSGWKQDLALMTELTKALEREGLVDNKKPYNLEIKDGEFYINNKKQPKEITDKFKKHFRNDNYTITNDGDQPTTLNYDEKPKGKPKPGLPHQNIDLPKFDPVEYQKELKLMYSLINGLHEDGLIDKNKPYEIQIKDGELYIDRKKQPKEVSDKFRKYFYKTDNYGFMND